MISFFANKKKKCRYLCQVTVHLRAAESQSQKQSCDLLVLVMQSIFYDQIVIKHYYHYCSCRFYIWIIDTAVPSDSWATTQGHIPFLVIWSKEDTSPGSKMMVDILYSGELLFWANKPRMGTKRQNSPLLLKEIFMAFPALFFTLKVLCMSQIIWKWPGKCSWTMECSKCSLFALTQTKINIVS